jgi:Ricin-type beta-trefoil lectin domain
MKYIPWLALCLIFLSGIFYTCDATEIRGIRGKCLDVAGGNPIDGTPIILWPCHGGQNQRWEITNNSEILGIGLKCLDVRGGGSANGTPIILWPYHGGENQKWRARYEQ